MSGNGGSWLSSVWLSLNVSSLISLLPFSGTNSTVAGEGGNKSTGNQVISQWMERGREVAGWVGTHKCRVASEAITTTTTVHSRAHAQHPHLNDISTPRQPQPPPPSAASAKHTRADRREGTIKSEMEQPHVFRDKSECVYLFRQLDPKP